MNENNTFFWRNDYLALCLRNEEFDDGKNLKISFRYFYANTGERIRKNGVIQIKTTITKPFLFFFRRSSNKSTAIGCFTEKEDKAVISLIEDFSILLPEVENLVIKTNRILEKRRQKLLEETVKKEMPNKSLALKILKNYYND